MLSTVHAQMTVNALTAATAWSNAFLASGNDENRPVLYRTILVEWFDQGVQLVATNGHLLIRTWIPAFGNDVAPPHIDRLPNESCVVMDTKRFAIGFMKAVLMVAESGVQEIEFTAGVEADAQPSLGEEFGPRVLTIGALGQELSLRLMQQVYPNWRRLDLGIDSAERVDGIAIAPRYLATLGRIRGANRIDLDFNGTDRAVRFIAQPFEIASGLLMPMRRDDAEKAPKADEEPEETDLDLPKVGRRTKASGRDAAAGRDG